MPSLDIRSCVVVFDVSGQIALAGHRRGQRWRIPSRAVGNHTITHAATTAARCDLGVEITDAQIGAALFTTSPSTITYALRAVYAGESGDARATALDVDSVLWVHPDAAFDLLDDEDRSWLRYLLTDRERNLVLARRDASSEFSEVVYA